ncbi:S-adenosyl-L-methionine-dependent methyltransferase [Artomyces pyxidatus]|uniref:S-adenosyl-L-methionine-dependent methyltransferase n=1 Tax=Artomyces pyxidatus TaxID=48021 RepID=A0ACB8T8Y9_9AGAM|nr:S-adenosyl-L-methionine-dependent methyltransferase [Artomyces pyxidatus]
MTVLETNHMKEKSYALPNDSEDEWERLNDLHDGVTRYLGGKLTLAPLPEMPGRILELGAGSGAWAIQVARKFPRSEVIAADLAVALPPVALPPNLRFLQMDITEPFPFKFESFDIVHARFVMIHIPHIEHHLQRIISLIKPGGLLLVEDIDLCCKMQGGAWAVEECFARMIKSCVDKGQEPHIGRKLEQLLRESQIFSEVNTRYTMIPLNPGVDPDLSLGALSNCLLETFTKILDTWDGLGVSAELRRAWDEQTTAEMEGAWRCEQGLVFSWSRKRG